MQQTAAIVRIEYNQPTSTQAQITNNTKKPIIHGISDFISFVLSVYKIKSAATEVTAQKTQTPIVAKPTLRKRIIFTTTESEFAFLSNSNCSCEKGIISL